MVFPAGLPRTQEQAFVIRTKPIHLNANKDGTVTIDLGSGPHMLALDELESLIAGLGQRRAHLPSAVPAELPQRLKGVVRGEDITNAPPFYVHTLCGEEAVMLSIRHPGFGWLAFRLPNLKAATMSRLLRQFTPGSPDAR